jgi:cysteine dioxygenase
MFSAGTFANRAPALGRRSSLDLLVGALAELDFATVPPTAVARILAATAIDDATLAEFVTFAAGRYTRNCVYRDARFELLILCWATDSASAIHDHGRSRCFVRVERGRLTVENYALVEAGRRPGPAHLARGPEQVLGPGDIDVRSAGHDIHRVAPHGGPAVSLHVYAKPLDQCLVFDVASRSCKFVESRYDREPPN